MTDRRFRFGLVAWQVPDMESWAGLARRTEALGYATLLAPDPLETLDPLTALAAVAPVTTSLRLGTFVLCDAFRDARRLAWEVASLNALADGRFELGIGAGHPGAAEGARRLGVPFPSGAERVARLADTLRIVRAQFGDADSAAGRIGRPCPPILVAGGGPRMLTLAAREADIVGLGWAPDTTAAGAKQAVERVRQAAPDRFDTLELSSNLVAIGDEPPPWLARFGIDGAKLIREGAVTVLTGTPRQMADTLRRQRDTLGISYVTINAAFAEQLAPVVSELAGR